MNDYFLTLVLFYCSECRSFCAKTMKHLTHFILFSFQILRPVYQDNQGTLGKHTWGRLLLWKIIKNEKKKKKHFQQSISQSLVLFACFTSCFIQQPGCTQQDRPLAPSPRAAVEGPPLVAAWAVEVVSQAAPASFVGLTTPRPQRGRPAQLTLQHPTTLSRTLTLPTTRTALSSARTLHTPTMVTSKWHLRSWFFPFLFR